MTQLNLALVIGATLLSACTATSQPAAPAGLPDTGQPALHAVSDARLRELMDQMNALMFERFMTQPEIDRERRIHAQKMADAAEKLGSAIDAILSRLPALNLNQDEQLTFRALAGKLGEQAHALNAQAKLNHIDNIEPMLDQMTATCSSCHTLFRKFGN
ncbi:MAG: cytochrome c [Methylococcaceae bacterium]|nr:cytochrome c [Methylococcaceae bacterium]